MSALDDLTRKLGLLQTASRSTAKQWAERTRKLKEEGKSWDQGAITAASELFAPEFNPTRYRYQNGSVEELVEAIEKL